MPRFQQAGRTPAVYPPAWVAPTAVRRGDVRFGPGPAVSHGAALDVGDGAVELGREGVVMDDAVLKGSRRAPLRLGRDVLIGPRACLPGRAVGDGTFLAAGSTACNFATVGRGAEVRANGVVHIRARLPADASAPIGWPPWRRRPVRGAGTRGSAR